MSRNRYFIGIVIPPPHFEKIEAIKQQLFDEHGLKGALRSPAHITLHMPFEWEDEDELIGKLRGFKFAGDFLITLKDFGFFAPRVIFVVVEQHPGLMRLHKELTHFAKTELKLFNEAENRRGFHPHVTVAFRDLKKNRFNEVSAPFGTMRFDGTFPYEGFSLLRLDDRWKESANFKTA
jgi:2'-5' RNA ligase